MDYEKKYNEALEKARQLCAYPTTKPFISDLQDLFPELAESEDEMVRRSLLDWLVKKRNNITIPFSLGDADRWIAWLEKQGEQKSITPKFKVGNTIIKRNKTFEYRHPFLIVEIKDNAYWCESGIICFISEQDNWELVEQKPEWSEEDEEIRKSIIDRIERRRMSSIGSENAICENQIDWLNSLRPQKQWKPSEERLKEGLDEAAHNWDIKVSVSPISMIMDGDRPIGTQEHITSHANSFKAGAEWVINKLKAL